MLNGDKNVSMATELHLNCCQLHQDFIPIGVNGSRIPGLKALMAPDCHNLEPLVPMGMKFCSHRRTPICT